MDNNMNQRVSSLLECLYKHDQRDKGRKDIQTVLRFTMECMKNERTNAGAEAIRLKDIDRLLVDVDTSKVTVDAIVAMLRSSFAVRNKLTNWTSFLTRAIVEINMRGLSHRSLLRGLL